MKLIHPNLGSSDPNQAHAPHYRFIQPKTRFTKPSQSFSNQYLGSPNQTKLSDPHETRFNQPKYRFSNHTKAYPTPTETRFNQQTQI